MKHEHLQPDSDWMRSVVDAHAADLTRYAASILGNADAARDVVQDVFLRLWKEQPASLADHLRPWLFRVCRNRALDFRRKESRMKPMTDHQAGQAASDSPDPQALAERQDSHARLLSMMRSLPDNQQEVVRLKFQNGMSYREIATVTDLSVSNVGFLLHTALTTLRSRTMAAGE